MGSGDTIGSVKNSHKNLLFQNITNNYLISELTAKEIVIKKVCDCAQSSSKNNDKGRIIGSRTDVESELAEYRKKNKNKIVFTTPNINSIKNKSFEVSEIVSNNIDVLIFQNSMPFPLRVNFLYQAIKNLIGGTEINIEGDSSISKRLYPI